MASTAWCAEASYPPPIHRIAADLRYQDPPGPNWAEVLNARIKAGEPMPAWPIWKAPADDAKPAKHLAYWRCFREGHEAPKPSSAARNQLLAAVLDDPTGLGVVLRFLPETDDAARKIAGVLDHLPVESADNQRIHLRTRAWIYQNSGLMRERVIADARNADWECYVFDEHPDWALAAIQRREPEMAAKFFAELATGPDPGLATVAARLLLEKADPKTAPKWREQLIAAAANETFPEKAREIAVHALLKANWDGRKKWVLTSLESQRVEPEWYIQEIWAAEDYWIPKLGRMTRGDNLHAREHAVHLLVRCEASVATLRPLLPWLKDAQWAGDQWYSTRLDFFNGFGKVKLPGAVPALKQAMEKETDDDIIQSAAVGLAFHKVKDAIPVMKAALSRAESRGGTDGIVASIHALGGLPKQEIITGLERCLAAFPDKDTSHELNYESTKPLPTPEIWIGKFFAANPPRKPAWAGVLAKRIEALAPENPSLASSLLEVLLNTKSGVMEGPVSAVLAKGSITADNLELALRRCHRSDWQVEPFQALARREGAIGAYAAVLAGDQKAMSAILAGKDARAQEALLAGALISGEKLDVKRVVPFLDAADGDKDLEELDDAASARGDLVDAADTYLRKRGDHEARLAYLEHERNKKDDSTVEWNPAKGEYGVYEDFVKQAAATYQMAGGPVEVFRLSDMAQGGTRNEWTVLAYQDGGIAVRETGDGRLGLARISRAQVKRIRDYVGRYRVDDLPALTQQIEDGVDYFYTHLAANGVRSVAMDNPPTGRFSNAPSVSFFDRDVPFSKGIVVYGALVNLFVDLFDDLEMKFSYGTGTEVLVPREQAEIISVWKQGADLRVLVENRGEGNVWRRVDTKTWALAGPVEAPPRIPNGQMLDSGSEKLRAATEKDTRALQPSSVAGEVWAADGATYSGESPTTEILRYEIGSSARRSIQTIKGIDFDGPALSVDEAEGMIYAAAKRRFGQDAAQACRSSSRPAKIGFLLLSAKALNASASLEFRLAASGRNRPALRRPQSGIFASTQDLGKEIGDWEVRSS